MNVAGNTANTRSITAAATATRCATSFAVFLHLSSKCLKQVYYVSALGQWYETYAGRVGTPCTMDSSSLNAHRRLGRSTTNTPQQGC